MYVGNSLHSSCSPKSWTTKELEKVHGFEYILPVKLTHWQFTYSSYFAPRLDICGYVWKENEIREFKWKKFLKIRHFYYISCFRVVFSNLVFGVSAHSPLVFPWPVPECLINWLLVMKSKINCFSPGLIKKTWLSIFSYDTWKSVLFCVLVQIPVYNSTCCKGRAGVRTMWWWWWLQGMWLLLGYALVKF